MFYSFGYSVPESWQSYGLYKGDGIVKYKIFDIINIDKNDEKVKELSDEFKNYADECICKFIDTLN